MSLGYFELYFTSIDTKCGEASLYRTSLPHTFKSFDDWFVRELNRIIRRWIESKNVPIHQWEEWKKFTRFSSRERDLSASVSSK